MHLCTKAPPGKLRFIEFNLSTEHEHLVAEVEEDAEDTDDLVDKANLKRTNKFLVYLLVDQLGLPVRGLTHAFERRAHESQFDLVPA